MDTLRSSPVRLALVDRDGTINVRRAGGYIDRVEDVVFLDGVFAAFATLAGAGIASAIVTNQSGIGRGLVRAGDVSRVNAHVLTTLREHGATVEHVYCCPHAPEDGCACRKPAPGLVQRAMREHDVEAGDLVVIGDAASDIAAGQAVGARTILVLTGRGQQDRTACTPTVIAPTLEDAVNRLIAKHQEDTPA